MGRNCCGECAGRPLRVHCRRAVEHAASSAGLVTWCPALPALDNRSTPIGPPLTGETGRVIPSFPAPTER